MSEIKLKPCPFCGGKASIHKWHFPNDDYTVVCDYCGAMIHNNYMSEEAAAEAWNERAEQPEIVRCKDCVAYGEMLTGRDMRMICHKFALNFPRDFYCAYAERRTDE